MRSSIPKARTGSGRKHVKSVSLRALAVAAHLERSHAQKVREAQAREHATEQGHAQESPPGHDRGRAEKHRPRYAPDPA